MEIEKNGVLFNGYASTGGNEKPYLAGFGGVGAPVIGFNRDYFLFTRFCSLGALAAISCLALIGRLALIKSVSWSWACGGWN